MFIFIYRVIYLFIYIHTHIHIYSYVCVYIYICMCIHSALGSNTSPDEWMGEGINRLDMALKLQRRACPADPAPTVP